MKLIEIRSLFPILGLLLLGGSVLAQDFEGEFIDGEYVEGYTNLGYVLAVSALGALGIDLILAARLLGIAGAITAVVLGPALLMPDPQKDRMARSLARLHHMLRRAAKESLAVMNAEGSNAGFDAAGEAVLGRIEDLFGLMAEQADADAHPDDGWAGLCARVGAARDLSVLLRVEGGAAQAFQFGEQPERLHHPRAELPLAERAGERLDDALSRAGERLEDAREEAEEAAEEVREALRGE